MKRYYTPTEYFEARLEELGTIYKFPTLDAPSTKEARAIYKTWRSELWPVWRDEMLGVFPPKVPLEPEVLEREQCDGYRREKVVYQSEPYASIPAYVLIPDDLEPDERRPGILALHGHGNGKSDVVGLDFGDKKKRDLIRQLNYDYAVQFVKRGYVTISPDARCFGERLDSPGDPLGMGRDPCNVNYLRAGLLGLQLLTLNVHDFMVTVDYLQTRPEVNPDRIGCVGLSFGGSMTLYGSATDSRIKVAVISCAMFSMTDHSVILSGMCGSQMVFKHLLLADIADIAGLIAPRPLLCEIGTRDGCFSIKTADRAYRDLRKIYDAAGVPDLLEEDRFDGEHEFSGRKAFDWFERWL